MKRLLFLCTGNYYRSRFAEIYFNHHARERQLGWVADSKGLALDPANPGHMSRYTVARLQELAIPTTDYRRPPADAASDDFASADHVVAVKRTEHQPLMRRRFPNWLEKVEFWEVHDIDVADPADALPHLEREVAALLDRLMADGHSA